MSCFGFFNPFLCLQTVAQVVDLEQGVYCIDNDRQAPLPKIVIGASTYAYLFKQEKRV